MDENKFKKLKELKYSIRKTCGNCEYFTNKHPSYFGTCDIHEYQHQKHTNSKRQLSVEKSGNCSYHKWNNSIIIQLGLFEQLREDKPNPEGCGGCCGKDSCSTCRELKKNPRFKKEWDILCKKS